MIDLCTDIGYCSLNKHGEQLCGDHIEVVGTAGSPIIVLADGLGSGVKANILSTLTSKIISTMMANKMSIEECVSTMAATLPVCDVRKIAYSTFTIIRVTDNRTAEIIRYDNPRVIMLRGGKSVDYPEIAETIDGKVIYKAEISLREDDLFIAMSDGAVHAGVGKTLNFGWQLPHITSFMEERYRSSYTAKAVSTVLLEKCGCLYENEPGDDTTVCALKIRPRTPVNLVVGPPANPEDDEKMMSLFFAKTGKHIVCGGTTSSIAAGFLGREVEAVLTSYHDPDIPPTASIKGVDLVTEGVITLSKVLAYAKDYLGDNVHYMEWNRKQDGASRIAKKLIEEASDINFYVGTAVNAAHQNPDLPIGFSIKLKLVEELSEALRKMGKNIKVSYF